MEIKISTPRWAVPLLSPARYKGVWGGEGSGKSQFAAHGIDVAILPPGMEMIALTGEPSFDTFDEAD